MTDYLLLLVSQAAGGEAGGGGASGPLGACGGQGIGSFIPLILMFVIFYVLLIYPQQKKAKQHRNFLSNLKKGDAVLTDGGIYGKITGLTDQFVTLEVAEKVRIKVARSRIAGYQGSEEKKGKSDK